MYITCSILASLCMASPKVELPVELRGIFNYGEEIAFSLHFPDLNQSTWLQLEDERHGVKLADFDDENRELIIRVNGYSYRLALKTPEEMPLAVVNSQGGISSLPSTHADPSVDYHDQQPNPAAARLVLEAARRRQSSAPSASEASSTYFSGSLSQPPTENAGTDAALVQAEVSKVSHSAPIVRRNRVYNFDYATKQ